MAEDSIGAEVLPVRVENIKKEKTTPPTSPKNNSLDEIIPTLFRTSSDAAASTNEVEEKKTVVAVKSSDEILLELFQVFNAAPPTADKVKSSRDKSKKKHKKHKKKSKKRKRDSKDGLSEISDSDNEEKDRKKKKIKEEKIPDQDGHRTHRKVKKEKGSRSRSRERSESSKIKALADVAATEKRDSRKATKIVVRNLKSSLVLAQSEAESKRKRPRLNSRSSSSSLSLSDEDTYEKERNSRPLPTGRTVNSRDRTRDDGFRSSYRESRSRPPESKPVQDMRERIDKKKLLEIARKNAMTMLKNGALPGITTIRELQRARYGGKSIDELTDFCKKLSNGEVLTDLSSVSSGDSDHDREGNSKAFHHPFILKDRGPIVLNIRNSIPLPTRSVDQTNAIMQQFPVSSGQDHRQSEMEWVPVEPTKPKPVETKPKKTIPDATSTAVVLKPPTALTSAGNSVSQMAHPPAFVTYPSLKSYAQTTPVEPLQPPPQPPSTLIDCETVFPTPPAAGNLDVSTIISQRLNAMRKLQEDPNDSRAMTLMENTQKDMTCWAASKFTPGKFLGSTGANILSARELQAGGTQAWTKKDAFTRSAPLSGGKGMQLLQKMGWQPGEALGKEKTGSLEPLLLEVKLDRKGLIADEEGPNRRRKATGGGGGVRNMVMSQQFMESKHPVSLLGELASKRKWGAPMYEVVHESGPHHHKSFVYQVILNGMSYTPAIPCTTKKEAKKVAAQVCLEQLGVLPTTNGPMVVLPTANLVGGGGTCQ